MVIKRRLFFQFNFGIMKKLFNILFILFIGGFLGSCASFNYEKTADDRTIRIRNDKGVNFDVFLKESYSRIDHASTSITDVTLPDLSRKNLTLILSHQNYESQEITIKRSPRVKAVLKDIGLGMFTFGLPLIIDFFNEDFYQLSSKSKEFSVEFKFTQSFMAEEFDKIKNTKIPQDYTDWLARYPYSNLYEVVLDKNDSLELEIALSTRKEYEIDDYIKKRRNSKFLDKAIGIKGEMVEARISFNKAKGENSVAAYEDYLKRYPRSLHNDEAKELLDKAAKRDIRLYFEKAKEVNTVESYTDFLKKYPSSLHNKEARVMLNDAAEKVAINSSSLPEIINYIQSYLMPNSTYYSDVDFKEKKRNISHILDLTLINSKLSNDPKKKYEDYSNLWKSYIEIMNLGLGTYLNPLEKSYAYKNVICDLLFNLLKETTNHVKQDELKIKLTNDFPYLDYPNKNTDIFYTLLMNLSTGSGKLKLFNTNFLNFYFSNVKSLNGRQEFNYRGSNFYAFQNITHEDLSFTNGKLSGVNSAFNQNGLDLVLKLHSNEKEIQYFQNNKLVLKKVILYDDKEYSYEFDNGVNLTLQILDDEIKSGIAYLKNKDYESAIRVFEKALANNFPEYLSQNVLLKKQLSLAQVQYSNYLTKQEAARLAEEKRQEAARLAEEKKQEAARIAEAQRKEAARLASACSRCGGTGTSSYGKTTHKTYCRYCGGNGIRGWDQCKYCDGRGWNWAKCMYCAGTGQEP